MIYLNAQNKRMMQSRFFKYLLKPCWFVFVIYLVYKILMSPSVIIEANFLKNAILGEIVKGSFQPCACALSFNANY